MTREYRDHVVLKTRIVEVARRPFSLEVNTEESCWEGERLYSGGWYITSWSCGAGRKVALEVEDFGGAPLKQAVLFTGVVGEWQEPDTNSMLLYVREAGSIVEARGFKPEIILMHVCVERVIRHPEGIAKHAICYYDAILGVTGPKLSVTDRVAFRDPSLLKLLPELVERMCEKLTAASKRVKAITALESGKYHVILVGSAAGALVHEIGHALEGDWGARLAKGTRIAPETFTLIDEPSRPDAPYNHPFDDEAVVARRRTLVEEGVVVEHLGTRWSAEGDPGSARGLFHPPKAMHTVLVVKRGDWSEREIVEETRRGILIETVYEAHLEPGGIITLRPELAWFIEHGEVVAAARLTRIRLRLGKELQTIDALGKTLWPRFSTEKGHPQTELTPTIRLQAYVD